MSDSENARVSTLRQRVYAACDELVHHDQKRTNKNVREALGGGSLSDIQPLVRDWKAKRDAAESATTPEPPQEFSDLWPVIWRMASAAQEAAQRSWNETRAELETDIEELQAEVRRLEDERDEKQRQRAHEQEEAAQTISALRAENARIEDEAARKRAAVAAAEKAQAEAEARAEAGERKSEAQLNEVREMIAAMSPMTPAEEANEFR